MKTATTFTLEGIYASIAPELQAVERLFDQELRSDLPFLRSLCGHIRKYRGKMLRPALTLLSAQACGGIREAHITIAAVLEMIHMATLVHDDVLDEATLRRREATVNAMNDNETAVLLGDFLISHAYHLCGSLDSQYAARTIASCTNTVCEGELLQVYNRHNWNLTLDQYLTIVSRKTAALTSVACMLGAKYAGGDVATIHALESYGMDVGIAFQVTDDVLDLVGSELETGKSLGRDAEKGELTLPIIHFLSTITPAARQAFRRRFLSGSGSREDLHATLNGSIEYATAYARQRVQSAMACLDCLDPSGAKDALLAIADFIIRRRF